MRQLGAVIFAAALGLGDVVFALGDGFVLTEVPADPVVVLTLFVGLPLTEGDVPAAVVFTAEDVEDTAGEVGMLSDGVLMVGRPLKEKEEFPGRIVGTPDPDGITLGNVVGMVSVGTSITGDEVTPGSSKDDEGMTLVETGGLVTTLALV